jgi:DTW domain-containing protein
MSMTRMKIEKHCPRCRLRHVICLCNEIPNLKTNTFISLIVHQKEFYLPSTTSYYTQLALPKSCEILIRGKKDQPLILEKDLEFKGLPIILFPDEDSEILDHKWVENNPGPYHLIVPDGTWSQAKKVTKREAFLKDIKRVKLKNNKDSKYKLRHAPATDKLCTLESIIMALRFLERENIVADKLNTFFDLVVERHLISRHKKKAPN